jgi:hypothetical protein
MAQKHPSLRRAAGASAGSSHGKFKHKAKGANLKAVLAAYGLKDADYQRVRDLMVSHLPKEPAHGR